MSSIERPAAKHLHTREEIAAASAEGGPAAGVPSRRRGEGNGVRVHLAYFAAVSVAVLVLVFGSIALAGRMM